VARTFEALQDETEWIAMREILPSASAPLKVVGHEDRDVLLSTVLPMAWPGMVRSDGKVMVALQIVSRSGDPSRDLAQVLLAALDAAPGSSIIPTAIPTDGPRLEDVLVPGPLGLTLHDGYDHWLEGVVTEQTDEVAASMQRANDSVIPTRALSSVKSAYWCAMAERSHLRWVLPEDEEPLLDALARVSLEHGLGLGSETRYVGSFRAHGRLVPVWDLPHDLEPATLEEPVLALRGLLDEALASPRELTSVERRARAGLLSRQLTLR
jgi:hypothetical protein